MTTTCSIDGCEKPHLARGWCPMHYTRWQRYGDPLRIRTPEDRFWSKVDKNGPDGYHFKTGANLGPCWLWTTCQINGYGQFWVGNKTVKAHRFAYELVIGIIPDGLEPDHLCRVHLCVRPKHLEPVTHRENILRGTSPAARHATKTHCPAGHEYSGENLYVYSDGRRGCRACHQKRNAARYAIQRSINV